MDNGHPCTCSWSCTITLPHNKIKCTTDDNRFTGCTSEFKIFKIIYPPPKSPNVDRIVVLTNCSSFFGGYGLHLLWNFWAMSYGLWVQDLYTCIDALGHIHTLNKLKGSIYSTSMLDVCNYHIRSFICQNQERTLLRPWRTDPLNLFPYTTEEVVFICQVLMVWISFWSTLKVYELSSRN